jgi:hypothetical protein
LEVYEVGRWLTSACLCSMRGSAMKSSAMKSSDMTQRLHPAGLAKALELWALRREKVLPLLDVRSEREARKLAQGCRRLAETERTGELSASDWENEWRSLRERAYTLLDNAHSVRRTG